MPLKSRFDQFHRDNLFVYEKFKEYALVAIKAGRKHFGAQMVIERIRWYTAIESVGDDFKINNNYAAFYARLFEKDHPQYKGFFRKRFSQADEGDS